MRNMRSFWAVAVFFLTQAAYAGAVNSGGGKAIVCRDSRNRIKSVEVLDLWEAREILGLKVPASKKTVDQQVEAAAESLKNLIYYNGGVGTIDDHGNAVSYEGADALAYEIRSTAGMFTKNSNQVLHLHGKMLTPVDDSLEEAYPNGCAPEQAVIFHDDGAEVGQVLINQDLVDRMDVQNQAALYIHEGLYRVLRRLDSEGNSLRARRAVGLAFAGHQFHSIKSLIPDDFVACASIGDPSTSSLFAFYNYNPPGGATILMMKPITLGGVYLTDFKSDQTGAGLQGNSLDDLLTDVIIPTPSTAAKGTGFSSVTGDGKIIDSDVRADFEVTRVDNSKEFALSVNHAVSPWQPKARSDRHYFQCVKGNKASMFP